MVDESCKFIQVVTRIGFEGNILLNNKNVVAGAIENATRPSTLSKDIYPYKSFDIKDINAINLEIPQFRNILDGAILGVWVKNPKEGAIYHLSGFRYRQVSTDWKNTEYSNITIAIVAETTQYAKILDDFTSESINDGVQVFDTEDYTIIVDWTKAVKGTGRAFVPNDYTIMSDIVLKKHNTIYLTLNDSNALNKGNGETNSLDALSYIAMPIPSLAMVNIVANNLPTTKTEDVRGKLEFNDMQGNRFAKNIIINAQGTSSLGLAKKNFSIDIMDENYDESHELKFGDWVSQDGFHLKAYLLDGVRVKPLAAYTFYENMLLTRGIIKDRAWKRMQLPLEISATSNNISDSYLQIDDGAKNHPMGFPFILYFNGVFYGIYCWQLKKHRKNYHQKKSTAEHIHLDGNISNPLLWKANGNIDWNKWAGKEYESSDSNNKEGIEIRNPKKLILTDGSVYEGEVNQGELVGYDSPNYNPSDEDMVRTAKVRDYIQNLSIRMNAITNMQKGDEKKLAIAELFDVESIIDYIIFGQIMGNVDGYKKNWQWVTYDGIKWAVNAYDLDSVWGWNGVNYVPAFGWWYTNDAPPVLVVLENYIDEIKARYAELRDNGVISVKNIVKPLSDNVKTIGVDFYDLEFEKWTMGVRDNLWRFEVWMEESIRNTDALMEYNKAA